MHSWLCSCHYIQGSHLQSSSAMLRVLTRTCKRAHIVPVLASLRWLPISLRSDFKILLLVFKALNGLAPSYIYDFLTEYVPNRPLRSCTAGLLNIPKMNYKNLGEAAFCVYAPKIWNALPLHIRQATSVESFKRLSDLFLWKQSHFCVVLKLLYFLEIHFRKINDSGMRLILFIF